MAKNNAVKTNKGFENTGKKKNKRNYTAPMSVSKKAKKYIADRPEGVSGDPYEYKMSAECAKDILRDAPKKVHPQAYLCQYITEQYGLRGYCQSVIIGD